MTKDIKISSLILISAIPIFLILLTCIYKLEYPSSLFIHSLEKGPHEYLLGNQSTSFKLSLDLKDDINKILLLTGESNFENHGLEVKAQFSFNPLGQLFKGTLTLEIDAISKLHCNLSGTKPVLATCQKVTKESTSNVNLPGPIIVSKKPNGKYYFSSLSSNNIFLENLILFLEDTHELNENEVKDIKLNLNLTSFPILKTELNKLIHDIS